MTGNAFTGSLEGTVPTKASTFYYRHADLLGVNKRKQSGRKKKADPFADDDDDELELCSHFSDEEFYEGIDMYFCTAHKKNHVTSLKNWQFWHSNSAAKNTT